MLPTSPMPRRAPLWLGCLVATLAIARPAQADPLAESLFQEGVELMKQKQLDEACPKLEASFEREALSGTLMTVAQCHDLQGKTATAWEEYERAAGLAHDEGRAEYEKRARELADEIEPRLTKLVLSVPTPTDGLQVSLDGEPVPSATYGVPVAVDPGAHLIDASAPGYRAWSHNVTLRDEGQVVTVAIPELTPTPAVVPDPAPQVTTTLAAPAPASAPIAPNEGDEGVDSGGVPTWAWIAGGLGIASAAVSFAGLGMQLAAASRLDDECGDDRQDCPVGYDFDGDHGTEKLGNGLFIGFGVAAIVGLGVGTTGIILGTTGDESSAARWELLPLASPEMGGAVVRAQF